MPAPIADVACLRMIQDQNAMPATAVQPEEASWEPMKEPLFYRPPLTVGTVRVAIAGCGVVGSALVRLLEEHRNTESPRGDARLDLVRVLVRDPARPRAPALAPELMTCDVDDFLATPSDVVVEAIGGTTVVERLALEALSTGRRYVTANKALIADVGPDLVEIAELRGGTLDFGAAVGGCIPIVRLLRERAAGAGIQAIRGVLNGTTNYVLQRLAEGISLDDALAEARARGFAEADPRRDLSGQDSAEKLAILAWLAFGCHPRRLAVHRRGLDAGTAGLSAVACAVGGTIRLLAEAVDTPDGVIARVEPVVVDARSPLASVRDEQNLIEIESKSAGLMQLRGSGAGGLATAGALLADLLRPASAIPLRGTWHPSAPADPRTHRWLLLVPRGRMLILRGFCDQHELEFEELLATAAPRSRRLGAVRCRAALLKQLVARFERSQVAVGWVRWQ